MKPILRNKHYDRPSVFAPANLLREARRQKGLQSGTVPSVCVLDPDGDLSRHLRDSGTLRNPYWACYHTDLYDLDVNGETVGVVGCAVGASFAALVSEELFASGCQFLISVTSAGQVAPAGSPPYFVLIDRALRDEGTSYHYLPAASYAHIPQEMLALGQSLVTGEPRIVRGGVWTTDAPFRETEEALSFARAEGLLAVEMEAAALYAFAESKGLAVICFAHVTNQMGAIENDFEKAEADGNKAMVDLIARITRAWRDAG
jgi:uridine phosphorylase